MSEPVEVDSGELITATSKTFCLVKSTYNQQARMNALIKANEAKNVCLNRSV